MTITPITVAPGAVAADSSAVSARSSSGEVTVRFAPGETSGPLDKVGAGVMSTLKNFEAHRAARSKAVAGVVQGPATAIDAAKTELLGPASVGGMRSGEKAGTVDNALQAMTRSFDYAIETQLIVKTGSQLSTSASSLMRGQ